MSGLKDKVISAIGWSASAKMAGQVFAWAITIIVIRLLEPADYGLMAMAVLVIDFLLLINPMGAALIQRENLDKETTRQIFGLIIVLNLLLFSCVFLGAPPIAEFFDEPRLVPLIRVVSVKFLLFPFVQLPSSMLERDLNLKSTSLVYLAATVAGSGVTLVMALKGEGVWALVWGTLTITAVRAIGLNSIARSLCWPRFTLRGAGRIVSFGGFVTGERVLWYICSQSDTLIVGRFLGKEMLGIYSVAMHLSSLIMHKTGEILYVVSLPAFSRIQQDKVKVAKSFVKSTRMMSFAVFPMFFGMSSVSQELVHVLLGESWAGVAPVLAVLVLVMPLRIISNLFAPMLQGIGRADASMGNLVIATIVMPLAFVVGMNWGLQGVSVAWLVAYPLVFYVISKRSLGLIGVTWRNFLGAMAKPAAISALMYGTVMVVKKALGDGLEPVLQLSALILIGVVAYGVFVVSLHREGIEEWRGLRQ